MTRVELATGGRFYLDLVLLSGMKRSHIGGERIRRIQLYPIPRGESGCVVFFAETGPPSASAPCAWGGKSDLNKQRGREKKKERFLKFTNSGRKMRGAPLLHQLGQQIK